MATVYGNKCLQELREDLACGVAVEILLRQVERLFDRGYITHRSYVEFRDMALRVESGVYD